MNTEWHSLTLTAELHDSAVSSGLLPAQTSLAAGSTGSGSAVLFTLNAESTYDLDN